MKTKAAQYLPLFSFLALGMVLGYGLSVLCPYSEVASKGLAQPRVVSMPETSQADPPRVAQSGTEKGEAYRPSESMDWNGVVVVAHPQNPVAEIETKDLTEIIAGKFCKWDEIGGCSLKIKVVTTQAFAEDLERSVPRTKESKEAVEITTYSYPSAIIPHVATDRSALGLIPVTGELQWRFASRHHSLKQIHIKTASFASSDSRPPRNSLTRERFPPQGNVLAGRDREAIPRICPKHTEILRAWLNNGTFKTSSLETLFQKMSTSAASFRSHECACVVCQLMGRGSEQWTRLDWSARR